jgi:hypothetical protein
MDQNFGGTCPPDPHGGCAYMLAGSFRNTNNMQSAIPFTVKTICSWVST